jgi:hypothetical protein
MSQEFVPWGGVTDPDHHDPANFRYLLHLDSGTVLQGDALASDAQYEYFLQNPSAIHETPQLSASLVDCDHRMLWQFTSSFHGFIIEVPKESVIATSPQDVAISERTSELDPELLLEATSPSEWNEVEVSTKNLVVKAVFWVVDNGLVTNRRSEEEFDFETVQAEARKAGLPLIKLDLEKY